MAFVHRAKRVTAQPSANTPSAVGPGSYYDPSISSPTHNLKLSYAPFASSAERGMEERGDAVNYAPGPGEYTAKNIGKASAPSITHSFVSAVPRFGKEVDPQLSVPGPGAYRGVDATGWTKRGPARRRDGAPGSRKGGVEWVRVSAPPSIPAPAQSFGYEENASGELVLQTPAAHIGHTGMGVDHVGPGEYLSHAHENPFAQSRKKGFAEWSKTRTHREEESVRRAASLPGPGSYTAPIETEPKRKGKKVSPFFASKVSRLRTAAEGDGPRIGPHAVPGPGTYSASSDFDRVASTFVPEQYQFFGSKTSRVVGGIIAASNPTPGPGTYQMAGSLKSGEAADPYAPKAAFKSTSHRFAADPQRDVPGPGAYRALTNTSVELSKKIFGRNTSFGTTEQRFHAEAAKEASANADLGPTSYSPRHTGAIRQARKPLSVFVSATKRFDAASGKSATEEKQNAERAQQAYASSMASVPIGIGSEPVFGNHSQARAQSSAFAAKQPRFDGRPLVKSQASSPAIGPGTYAPNATNLYRAAPAVSSAFKSIERSAGGVYKKDQVPGPGTYTKDVTSPNNSSFITRSFNITISDV